MHRERFDGEYAETTKRKNTAYTRLLNTTTRQIEEKYTELRSEEKIHKGKKKRINTSGTIRIIKAKYAK